MDRRLLTSRWLGLHVAVLVALVGCAVLGAWQLDRARDQRAQSVRPAANLLADPVPLDELLPSGARLSFDDVSRAVTVTGTYDPAGQRVVPDRDLDGRTGSLVVAPLVTAPGEAVLVVRGWLPSPDGAGATAPPAGEVTVGGWLGASEPAPGTAELPTGQVGSVHVASLVNELPYELRDGYVARIADEPADETGGTATAGAPGLVTLAPPQELEGGRWPLQNLFYAAEWWIFGLVAVAFWVSAVRRRDPVSPSGAPVGPVDRSTARS